ncbi:MAG: ABC transporter permease, partial [Vicinamibacterales bacterium]
SYGFDTYARAVIERTAQLPGVESVALAVGFPTTDLRQTTAQFPIEPIGAGSSSSGAQGMMDRISPGFFRTTGVPLRAGREFEWGDSATAPPVAIITRPLAERLFPGRSAIGRQLRVPGRKPSDLTIVGIAEDFSPGDPRIQRVGRIYVPMTQEPGTAGSPVVLIRSRQQTQLPELRAAIAPLGRHRLSSVQTIDEQTNRLLTQERLLSALAMAFGMLGAMVGALGLYALLAQSVSRRTREIGVRLAIGASRGAIRSLVMRDGVTLVLTGVAAGVPLAFAAGYVSRTLLFEMSPFDGQAAGAAGGLVMLAGVCGALMPAIRASRTEPAVAMRPE